MTTGPGLTDADLRKLADMAAHGVHAYTNSSRGIGDTPREPSLPNHSDAIGDSRGITLARCNAIRCAAVDGLEYRTIADRFGVDISTAYDHATGTRDCNHDALAQHDRLGVAPVPVTRRYAQVDAVECERLRDRYAAGESVTALHERTGRSESTVYRHVSGACSHD